MTEVSEEVIWMLTLREVVLLLIGAQAFHTLSHIWLPMGVAMPLQLKWPHMTFTARWNTVAIAINALVLLALILWAMRL